MTPSDLSDFTLNEEFKATRELNGKLEELANWIRNHRSSFSSTLGEVICSDALHDSERAQADCAYLLKQLAHVDEEREMA